MSALLRYTKQEKQGNGSRIVNNLYQVHVSTYPPVPIGLVCFDGAIVVPCALIWVILRITCYGIAGAVVLVQATLRIEQRARHGRSASVGMTAQQLD